MQKLKFEKDSVMVSPLMLCISPENGFCELQTESVSSKVLVKDGFIYKINDRNSLARQKSDLKVLHERLAGFASHLPASEVIANPKNARW